MNRVIVTGGLGFVGNEVVRQLKNENDILIIDSKNRTAPVIDDLKEIALAEVDITNREELFKVFKSYKPDYVIHLAAIHFIPECNDNPARTIKINVEGTQNILDASEVFCVKHVITISSGAVYADSSEKLNESISSIKPVDIYGYSKLFCENISELKAKQSNLAVTVVRLFNVFGPRETNPHIIPEIITQLKKSNILKLGNIKTFRDFIFTEDVASSLIKLMKITPENNYRIINLGSGTGYSIEQVIKCISELLNLDIKIEIDKNRFRISDKQVQIADTAKIKEILPNFATKSLEEGLKILLQFEGFKQI